MKIIGVDVGGTFTDLILTDSESGEQVVHKVPSTPSSQDQAVIRGIQELLRKERISPSEVGLVVHGTTVATNAMLERKGARVCLITTTGFEDVLEIGRQNREDIYDMSAQRPMPLVERNDRLGIRERVDWKGDVIEPLASNEVDRIAREILARGPESVAISLLFSFRYPEHERSIAEGLRKATSCYVAASSMVLPEFREFERTSTTVLEAYLGPLVLGYLERLNQSIGGSCPNARLNVMQSNGGTILCSNVEGRAIGLAISGLAGGVIGGWHVSKLNDIQRALTLDMGGTSCDISAVTGSVLVKSDNEVAGLPLRFPSVDVKTIGAGGGSIAWIDEAGILHVGPQSAGADPGPASYSKGGKYATVTDANLVLGRINPDYFVGGEIKLDRQEAIRAVSRIADSLDMTVLEAAAGIIRISTANMVQAIREVTIERGLDPRTFVLVPFGGAGPTQATNIAESLDIERILVPQHPGITSALGLITADLRVDLMKSIVITASNENRSILESTLDNLSKEAKNSLLKQGARESKVRLAWKLDMRYKGQSHELMIDLPNGITSLTQVSRETFEREHLKQFGYVLGDREIEWVTARVIASAPQSTIVQKDVSTSDTRTASTKRECILKSGEKAQVPVHHRNDLPVDKEVAGPLIIEQLDTTIWVDIGWHLKRSSSDVIWLRRGQ